MQKFHKRNFILGLLAVCFFFGKAQNDPQAKNLFINADLQSSIDFWHIQMPDYNFHSAFKPYLSSTILKSADSAVPFTHYQIRNFFFSKTINDAPEIVNHVNLQVHPIMDAVLAYDGLEKRVLTDVIGGANLKININNDFTFSGTVFGGNTKIPFYMDTAIKQYQVLPGLGQVYGSYQKGYQVFDYNGYISYSPQNNKIFNFQLGRDKHFIGDGYRSVLLSDYANPYPYFRINTNIWHLQYNVWWTYMQDVTYANGIKKNFQDKYAAFHYLSWNVFKQFNIGIFENVVWKGKDSNQVRNFDAHYMNPIIFYRPVEYAVGSPDNSFLGLNMNVRVARTLKLYGQLGLDEFFLKEIKAHKGWWANKQAWQLGLNYINAFNKKGLGVQIEYNEARPYTYSHGIVAQNYAHYGMPLANPLGANYREFLSIITYRKDRFQFSIKGSCSFVGKDTAGTKSNMGQNIFLSYTTRPYEYGHKTLQGDKHQILQSDIRLTYWIIPNMNARFELGYIQRSEKSNYGYALENPYIYFGFKTSFWNIYKD